MKKRIRLCGLYTLLFSLLAHGYRYLTLAFSGDSVLLSQAGEEAYQTALGRFLQPVYWQIRGVLTVPFLIGLFTTAFLFLTAWVLVSLFQLERPLDIAILCGLVVTSETFAVSNAAYLPWTDVYALSLLFAVLGVAVFWRFRFGFLLSPFFFLVTLGLYQSYLPSAAAVMILLLLVKALEGERAGKLFVKGLQACFALLAGLLLYALTLRLLFLFTGSQASDEYNGVGIVELVEGSQVPRMLLQTYMTPVQYLFVPSGGAVMPWHVRLTPVLLNLALLALAALLIVFKARRLRPSSILLILFLVGVLPLGMNFVQFIAKGMVSGLTIYAFNFFYVMVLVLAVPFRDAPQKPARWAGRAASLLLCVFVGLNVIHSNQMSFKRDLEYQSTLSAMSRVLGRVEETEGYVPGETPVVILGMLPSSHLAFHRPGFEAVSRQQGMRYPYAAAYETSTPWYLQMALGTPIHLVDEMTRRQLSETPQAQALPVYPADGFTQMIDGMLYIRFN